MKRNNHELVVITCKYHNGRNGYHDSYSSREGVVAIGSLNGRCLIIDHYTLLFEEHRIRCIHCPYAKFYFMNGDRIRERNGNGKIDITGIKLRGEPRSHKEIEKEAIRLGFPYL
jgi:hypothetical protein